MTVSIETIDSLSSPKRTKRGPTSNNGVNTEALFATINAVKAQPELAKFQFSATNQWLRGTHSRSQYLPFSGAGAVHTHAANYSSDSDHPAVLCGEDQGPTPIEFLLHGLAGCLTAGIANIASARGITLESVTSTVEGDIDLQGILGLSDEVRNGYEKLRVRFEIRGDAEPEVLREIVEQSRRRSAVFDVLTRGTPIDISVEAR